MLSSSISSSTTRFFGKSIVVTGGGSGIGLQTAKDLYVEGAIVHILGGGLEKLEKAKEEISSANGSKVFSHCCDISDYVRVQEAFRSIEQISRKIYGPMNSAAANPFRARTSYIRVNAVRPGYVRTELTIPLFERLGQELFEQLVGAHAMKCPGRSEEISRAVLFLLSEEASFITGVALPVDGGYLLKG